MKFYVNNETTLYKGHFYVKGVVKDLLHGKHPLLANFTGKEMNGEHLF